MPGTSKLGTRIARLNSTKSASALLPHPRTPEVLHRTDMARTRAIEELCLLFLWRAYRPTEERVDSTGDSPSAANTNFRTTGGGIGGGVP